MELDVVPTLIDQFRETIEGPQKPDWVWITDGKPGSDLLGTLDQLTPAQAFAEPTPGHKSIAAHVEHLRFTFDVTAERMAGKDPRPDWASSWVIADTSPAAWEILKREVRRSYQALLDAFNAHRDKPIAEWNPWHAAGLAAMIGHNAYHLAAIRQMAQVLKRS